MTRHIIAANHAHAPESPQKRARLSKGSVAFPKGGDIPAEHTLYFCRAICYTESVKRLEDGMGGGCVTREATGVSGIG